jgi:DnaK suppressor protein
MQRRRKGSKPKAATGDVAGDTRLEQIPAKWRTHYRCLVEIRDHLRQRQRDLTKDALAEQPVFSTHMADAGTDTYDRYFSLSMRSTEQDALYEIDEALDRIRNGTCGICELTGKRIEPERLEVLPWTRFTATAERQLEDEGVIKRTQFAPRETLPKLERNTGAEEAA